MIRNLICLVVLLFGQAKPAVVAIGTRAQGVEPAVVRLVSGSTVRLEQNQSRVLVHLPSGQRVKLSGPCVYRITDKGFAYVSGTKGAALPGIKSVKWQPSDKANGERGRLGAVITRGDDDHDLGPKGVQPAGGVESADRLEWSGFIDGDAVSVSVVSGGKEIWSAKVPRQTKTIQLPEACRLPGVIYQCSLMVLKDGRLRNSVTLDYRLLTENERSDSREFLQQLEKNPGDFDLLVTAIEFYREVGLTSLCSEALKRGLESQSFDDEQKVWIKDALKRLESR
jgi:hypothetical protein